jgi:hypothetical protein
MRLDELERAFEERVSARFYGKHEGVVADVQDPLGIGRLRAKVPAVLGEDVLTGWALPCAPFGGGKDRGFLFLPEPGDTVWIEFAAGDPSRPIWTGSFWGAPTTAGGTDDLAQETGAEVPTSDGAPAAPGRAILRTRTGHRLVLDDGGDLVILAAGNGKTEIRLTPAGEVVITADRIQLGANAGEPLVLGDSFMQLFNQHTHATGVGPSGPPTPPMQTTHLSSKNKTE